MCIVVVVLIFNDVVNHKVDRSNLIVIECGVNCRSSILILVKQWELIIEILSVFVMEKRTHRPGIEG